MWQPRHQAPNQQQDLVTVVCYTSKRQLHRGKRQGLELELKYQQVGLKRRPISLDKQFQSQEPRQPHRRPRRDQLMPNLAQFLQVAAVQKISPLQSFPQATVV